jgi:hypothetical protein
MGRALKSKFANSWNWSITFRAKRRPLLLEAGKNPHKQERGNNRSEAVDFAGGRST